MGNNNKKVSTDHFLHYYKYNENKLYIFNCEKEIFYEFPMFKDAFPFFPGNMESISVESMKLIYFIGGLGFKETPLFSFEEDNFRDNANLDKITEITSEEDFNPSKNKMTEEQLAKRKGHFYAKTDKLINELDVVRSVYYINLSNLNVDKLFVEYEDCEKLAKIRTNHCLVLNEPYIYVIGGICENEYTNECYKYNINTKKFEQICSIEFLDKIENASGVSFNNNIYVFNSNSKLQSVHKYLSEYDLWELIPFKSDNFKIPPTYNPNIFIYDSNKMIYLNGSSDKYKELIDYYIYDTEKNIFTFQRTDRSINSLTKDRQGNKDYTQTFKIYSNFTDKSIRVYDKINFMWKEVLLNTLKIDKGLGKERGCTGIK